MKEPTEELFEFQPDFLNLYTFFVNKYFFKRERLTKILMEDLRHQFGSIAIVLFSFEQENGPFIKALFPPNKGDLVKRILIDESVEDRLRKYLTLNRVEEANDETFLFDVQLEGSAAIGSLEIDLITLPQTTNCEKHKNSAHFFMLVDPVQLSPSVVHPDMRTFERRLIAGILDEWWVWLVAKQAFHVSEDGNSPPSDWIYTATLSEILQEGYRSSEYVRTHSSDKVIFFEDEEADKVFFQEGLEEIQSYVQFLTYWCRWVKSHHDLERQRQGYLSSLGDVESSYVSITDWVKKQKLAFSDIDRHLKRLRWMTAEAFRTGTPQLVCHPQKNRNRKELFINYNSLLCFALNQWLVPEAKTGLHADLGSGMLSDVEFCRTMHSLAVMTHYLSCDTAALFGNKTFSPEAEDFIHRLVQLVSRYGHCVLGIPNRIDLRAHLLHAARGEPALHTLKHFYRDHFFHALEVCFLGHVLLEMKLGNQCLSELIAGLLPGADKALVLRLWYLAALLHDIGYAIDVLEGSRNYLRFFKHSTSLSNLDQELKQAIEQLTHEKVAQELDIEFHSGLEIEDDHGVVSALHLRSLLEHIAQDDCDVEPDVYTPTIQAIALHNLRRHDRISFAEKPLAFLLVLCDQLQEWKRPRLTYSTSPNWLVSRLSGAPFGSENLEGAFKSVSMNAEVLSPDSEEVELCFCTNQMGISHLQFKIEYDEQINRNSGVFQLWLDSTLNFQRLGFDQLSLEITVTYVTPLYQGRNGDYAPLSQFYRLRDAAHETHMSFLTEWFPTEKQVAKDGSSYLTNGAVTYQLCDNKEKLTLSLRELSHKELMTRDMDAFWDCIKEWRHFNDDRDFPGDYAPVIPQ